MRKFILFPLILCMSAFDIMAAPVASPRARVAVSAPAARGSVAARSATPSVSARAAVPASASNVAAKPTVAARAGQLQSVVGGGVAIAAKGTNTTVNEQCREKYFGCMDSFCMVDTENGGRCQCSDRINALNTALKEIEDLDAKSYKLITEGVEKIDMGRDREGAMTIADAAIAETMAPADARGRVRRTVDMSAFDAPIDFSVSDFMTTQSNPLDGKTGDSLHRAVADMCVARMPECVKDIQMIQMLYTQQITNDCGAYTNVLAQRRNESAKKVAAAEAEIRMAALDAHQSANKWNLGQCLVQFKDCMVDTGGCGEDWSGCAIGPDMLINTTARLPKQTDKILNDLIKQYGITAKTADVIGAKRPLCDYITESCTNVATQVWPAFVREIGPSLKSAEIIAEDNQRQSCLGNISTCFQNACRETMDPKNPEGSFNACLTNPANVLHVCKVPLNNCGIDATNIAAARRHTIWNSVAQRMAAMRVGECETAIRVAMQNTCGEDYGRCVGWDLDDIFDTIHNDTLAVACNKNGGTPDDIMAVVGGLMAQINTALKDICENRVQEIMDKTCGGDCYEYFRTNKIFGTDGMYLNMADSTQFTIEGLVDFSEIRANILADDATTFDANASPLLRTVKFNPVESVCKITKDEDDTDSQVTRSQTTCKSIVNTINSVRAILESDSTLADCVNGADEMGRVTTGSNVSNLLNDENKDFSMPNLLNDAMNELVVSGLRAAQENYNDKKAELMQQALDKIDELRNTNANVGMCYDPAIMGRIQF